MTRPLALQTFFMIKAVPGQKYLATNSTRPINWTISHLSPFYVLINATRKGQVKMMQSNHYYINRKVTKVKD